MTQPEFPPADGRQDPPYVADERPMLEAWLEFHRATLLHKCHGLDEEQLKSRSVPPSSLSLLGLVRHMTEVEKSWFLNVLGDQGVAPDYWTEDDLDGDFDHVAQAEVSADLDRYRAMVERCRTAAAGVHLDTIAKAQRRGTDISLRWIYLHMIEEYARHNGHADLLRERIDGSTGD